MSLKLLLIGKSIRSFASFNKFTPSVLQRAHLSSRGKKPVRKSSKSAPPPPVLAIHEAWTEVVDQPSGQIYWWNTQTNETTQLGAPKPTGPTALAPAEVQQQSGGMMSGLGGVVAQGFAFGVGSSVAHGIVGSMFGGGSSSGGDSGSGGDSYGDDGGFDI